MNIIVVGFGGVLGSITRYRLGKLNSSKNKEFFPLNTFLINITGAFLLGLMAAFQSNRILYLFLGDGFLGAYTTFSTFMYEGFHLFAGERTLNAAVYIILTLLLGIISFYIGLMLSKYI